MECCLGLLTGVDHGSFYSQWVLLIPLQYLLVHLFQFSRVERPQTALTRVRAIRIRILDFLKAFIQ